MYLLTKLIQSQALQDSTAVARGLYRVADGLLKTHNAENTPSNLLNLKQQDLNQQAQKEEVVNKQTEHVQVQKQQQPDQQNINRQVFLEQEKLNQFKALEIEQIRQNEMQRLQAQALETEKIRVSQFKAEAQRAEEEEQIKQNKIINEMQNEKLKSDAKVNSEIDNNIPQNQQTYTHQTKFSVGSQKAVPASSVSRAWGFGTLGVQLAYGAAKELIRTSIGGKTKVGGAGLKGLLLSEENADVLSQSLCKMRGAPLKMAQALSIQEDEVIPKHVRDAFEKARQSADIMPKKQLFQMLTQEFGENWMDNFSSFEETPFAAASIGEVHRAVLKDGTKVAIKIQYPGVKESVDSDLNNLRRLMLYTGVFPKQMFLERLIDYSRKELHEECDYITEANKQKQMRKFLENYEEYYVPKIIENLSTERIMTSELIEGDTIDYISQNYSQEMRDDIGKRLMKLTLSELFLFQTMQTDPNPSNFYFNRNTNKLNLIDFGGVHSYSLEFMDKYIDVIYSSTTNDKKRVLEISQELGYLTGEENQTMKTAHVESVMTVGEPFSKEGKYDFGEQTLTTRTYKLMPQMLKNRLCPPPQETYSIHRKLSGAFLLSMKMRASYNCRDLFMPLYEDYKKKRQGLTRTFL